MHICVMQHPFHIRLKFVFSLRGLGCVGSGTGSESGMILKVGFGFGSGIFHKINDSASCQSDTDNVKWGNVVTFFLHKTIFFSESFSGDLMLYVATKFS
jgi:hypothetical protein